MVKLQDLLTFNKMVYSSDIKEKHQKKMNSAGILISEEVSIPHKPFPENASRKTRNELQWLLNYNNGVIDKQVSKDGDDVLKVFDNYCKDNNLKYNKEYYNSVLKESGRIILKLKYYYNRPRPYQIAEFYGIPDFKIHNLDSAKTPSYPSGHTTQAHLIAELLGKEHSGHYIQFKKLADFVSESRLMARAHYPSDCRFGKEVAQVIATRVI